MKDTRPSPAKRGYDSAWIKISRHYLKAHPICEYCGEQEASQVHHRISIREGGGHDSDNLAACCQACHNIETGAERSGRRVYR